MSNVCLYFEVDPYTFCQITNPTNEFMKRTMMCVYRDSEIHGLWCLPYCDIL